MGVAGVSARGVFARGAGKLSFGKKKMVGGVDFLPEAVCWADSRADLTVWPALRAASSSPTSAWCLSPSPSEILSLAQPVNDPSSLLLSSATSWPFVLAATPTAAAVATARSSSSAEGTAWLLDRETTAIVNPS